MRYDSFEAGVYTSDDFAGDVTGSFEFLESEYAMQRSPTSGSGAGTWITYSGTAALVTIEFEPGGYCGVTVRNPRHVKEDPMERSEFDLEEIIAVHGNAPRQRQEPRSMSEAVARAAQALRAAGDRVLRGDFEALHERQKLAVQAARRQHPLAPK
jgi:hypothetical protein